jgi:hypothetical protein
MADIDTPNKKSFVPEWLTAIPRPVLIGVAGVIVVLILLYMFPSGLSGFASPDGVVARKGHNQVRDDSTFDRAWNLKELESSVALLNRNSA